jgi:hypothetical protein
MTECELRELAATIAGEICEVLDRMMRVVELQHTCIEQLANRLEVLELERLRQRASKPEPTLGSATMH